jgi:multiple sugar transport system substrate-binding protein
MALNDIAVSRRGLLVAGASALGAAALASCGAGSARSSGSEAVEGSIKMLTPIYEGTSGKDLLEGKLLPAFYKDHPKVKVSVDYTDYSTLNEKITTALASGLVPDVIGLGVGWVEPFAAKNVLAKLNLPDAEAKSLTTTYPADIVESGKYHGSVYALPIMLDTRFGLCRTDLLAAAGITRPPANLDEVREYAIELTQRKGGKLARAGLDILTLDTRQMFETILFAFGGTMFTADGRKPTFNDEHGVAALQWLADLVIKDKVIDPGFSNSKATSLPILDGRAAMAIGHNNWWTTMLGTHPEVKGSLTPFVLRKTKSAIFAGGTIVSVSARSKHLGAARALARYLSNPQPSLRESEQRGNVPAALSTRNSAYVKQNPLVQFALANMRYAHHEGGTAAWLQIRSEIKDAVDAALLGQKSPKAALDDLAATARGAIADYGG